MGGQGLPVEHGGLAPIDAQFLTGEARQALFDYVLRYAFLGQRGSGHLLHKQCEDDQTASCMEQTLKGRTSQASTMTTILPAEDTIG